MSWGLQVHTHTPIRIRCKCLFIYTLAHVVMYVCCIENGSERKMRKKNLLFAKHFDAHVVPVLCQCGDSFIYILLVACVFGTPTLRIMNVDLNSVQTRPSVNIYHVFGHLITGICHCSDP